VLAELGFGLDLGRCAATGATEDLAYVSPKSGRAVSLSAGAPYADRLLARPRFLDRSARSNQVDPEDIRAGFALTEHFLRLHVFEPRGQKLPEERQRFAALAAGQGALTAQDG
jgi:DNA repair protein RecO (recombination protein O)